MYALIKDKMVHNVIDADEAFITNIKSAWDLIIPVTLGETGIGWVYENGKFTEPPAPGTNEPVSLPVKLTHLQFRELFTQAEQEWADELEATFETHALLTPEQKRKLRTGYKNFNLATGVELDDPRIAPMLDLYVALGGLKADRPAQILSNSKPL